MQIVDLLQSPGASVVDVREPWEFDDGHFPGSLNIPLGEVPTRMDELLALSRPLILVCRSGNRSGMATSLLQGHGAQDVYNGGAWDSLPV